MPCLFPCGGPVVASKDKPPMHLGEKMGWQAQTSFALEPLPVFVQIYHKHAAPIQNRPRRATTGEKAGQYNCPIGPYLINY